MKQGLGKPYLIPSQVGHRGAKGGVAHGHTHNQSQGKNAVDNALTKFGMVFAILLVKVQGCGFVGKGGEHDVVHFAHRAANRMLKNLPYIKRFEIQTGHQVFLERSSKRKACVRWGLSTILPSNCTAPAPLAWANASTMRCAWLISCCEGVKPWLITST